MTAIKSLGATICFSALFFMGCAVTEDDESPLEETIGSTEQALVSCYQNGCNGIDPANTVCANDATTVGSNYIWYYNPWTYKNELVGLVELRWSNQCGTNWSRVTRYDGAYAEAMMAKVERYDGVSYFEHLTGYGTIWSPMVYARYICARAHGLIDMSWTSGSNMTGWVC